MPIPWIHFLKQDEQVLVEDFTKRWTVNGPGVFVSGPFQRVRRRPGVILSPTTYLHIRDTLTGELRSEFGPKLYFPSASEQVVKEFSAIPLKHNQYIRLIDKRTGVIRVEKGETSVYLNPTEEVLEEAKTGINVDEQTAVLVRDIASGQLELITEPQVFFPAPHQEVVEVQRRIVLEDHETVVIKDKAGKYVIRRGTDADRAFFLQPYTQLVQFLWSTGVHKDQRTLKVTHIDSRPKFMWYEFEARTQDNVELIIGITFFWQIADVEAMIGTTDDVPGDLCSHARSVIIQSISQTPLERVLAGFNTIIRQAVVEAEDRFYSERGVKLHSVEVRSITCKDPTTQRILQEMIQETTNRLNRLQKQESENEVKLKQIKGETEAEEERGQLLNIRQAHVRAEALMEGQAEADKVLGFLSGLGTDLSLTDRLALFNTLRKQQAIEKLSTGTAQLYFTPADVDLSIETRPNSPRPPHV